MRLKKQQSRHDLRQPSDSSKLTVPAWHLGGSWSRVAEREGVFQARSPSFRKQSMKIIQLVRAKRGRRILHGQPQFSWAEYEATGPAVVRCDMRDPRWLMREQHIQYGAGWDMTYSTGRTARLSHTTCYGMDSNCQLSIANTSCCTGALCHSGRRL
jgi:hypothetical protein